MVRWVALHRLATSTGAGRSTAGGVHLHGGALPQAPPRPVEQPQRPQRDHVRVPHHEVAAEPRQRRRRPQLDKLQPQPGSRQLLLLSLSRTRSCICGPRFIAAVQQCMQRPLRALTALFEGSRACCRYQPARSRPRKVLPPLAPKRRSRASATVRRVTPGRNASCTQKCHALSTRRHRVVSAALATVHPVGEGQHGG